MRWAGTHQLNEIQMVLLQRYWVMIVGSVPAKVSFRMHIHNLATWWL